MQAKLPDGSIMVSGGCSKDAELQYVGEKQSRKCGVGLAVGKRNGDETIWVNVVAWHGLASVLSTARKGDAVFVIGKIESREYNDKTYTDLVAEFVSVCSVSAAAGKLFAPQATMSELDFETSEEELPF